MPQPAPVRSAGPRHVHRAKGLRGLALVAAAALGVLLPVWSAEAQQSGSAPVYIPGPGQSASATESTSMGAMLATPAAGQPAPPPAPADFQSIATTPGDASPSSSESGQMVRIAGPGETSQQAIAAAQAAQAAGRERAALPTASRYQTNVAPYQHVSAASVAPVVVPAAGASGSQPYAAASAAGTTYMAGNAAANNAALAPNPAFPNGQEDGEAIRATALAFLQQQSQGLPGQISVSVAPVFSRGLAACTSLEPFMPPGARPWGRTTIGVRCIGTRPWTLYVQGNVAVMATYYMAARTIGPGDTLSPADVMARNGDLTSLPQAVITDPSQALGAVALERITAGLPLRTDMLRSISAVTIGQTVRVVAVGAGFTISSEGSVLNNASPGQRVQVRTAGGQIITGIVKDASTVQVPI
ncbi:flagellar basal body P-ring formation chaperone FlgA [Burkholderia sp. WAC0059]|uniref:flagellar basal body P-ring formation chaperone FlgA n=1 Tax=Burkholderia sp. WAC0059 TaxID=2066022 RepID=UPI002155D225|nr:flagellar basal body P-ring formation chaperone FlgA [Burkholderia sp. WAC0059]